MTASEAPNPCRRCVVVVEDEPESRELLQELLESRGYRVMTAGDGLEALDVLRRADGEVCLVILDLVMPRLDGFGVLDAIGKDPKLADLRVCVATSMPEQAPAGVTCLAKPVEIDRLFDLVAANCEGEPGAILH